MQHASAIERPFLRRLTFLVAMSFAMWMHVDVWILLSMLLLLPTSCRGALGLLSIASASDTEHAELIITPCDEVLDAWCAEKCLPSSRAAIHTPVRVGRVVSMKRSCFLHRGGRVITVLA